MRPHPARRPGRVDGSRRRRHPRPRREVRPVAVRRCHAVQKPAWRRPRRQRPANVAITLNPKVAYDKTDNPFSTSRAVIFLDRAIAFGGGKLPGCTAPKVLLEKCPANTKVGTGYAKALAAGLDET